VTPRAGVLLVHGLGEHSGRWAHVGDQLAAAGLETFGWDHRGFGASAGERAWIDRWSRFHDDVEDRLAAIRAALPGLPVILYGHSMGGLIALGYCVSARPPPDLHVLSAPGIDDNAPRWKHALAPLLAASCRGSGSPTGSRRRCSRDPARQEATRADPLNLDASTTGFGVRFFEEQARVRAAAARLSIPTLVIHGLDDPIVPPRSSEPLAALPGVTRRPTPASDTSSTTSPRARRSWPTSSPGSTSTWPPYHPRRRRCRIGPQLKIASGSAAALRVWPGPQTRRT
jgi:alpha-beta hydrolase superfamily lysophospholipase